MEISQKTLGARIRKLRKTKGLSQEQLSEKVGIESKHLSRLEVGKNFPSLKTLESIARSLDIDLVDILEPIQHASKSTLVAIIKKILNEASEEELKKIVLILRAVLR